MDYSLHIILLTIYIYVLCIAIIFVQTSNEDNGLFSCFQINKNWSITCQFIPCDLYFKLALCAFHATFNLIS
jgi:hypothetical protein